MHHDRLSHPIPSPIHLFYCKNILKRFFQLLLLFPVIQDKSFFFHPPLVWMIWWRRTIKTRRLFKSSSLSSQDTFRNSSFSGGKKEWRKKVVGILKQNTNLGESVRGLSINKDFFFSFSRSNDTKVRRKKSEQRNWKAKDVFIILFLYEQNED